MIRKRYLLATMCAPVVFVLAGCPPPQSTDDSASDFFVAVTTQAGVQGYVPQGWGWKPSSKVSIQLWHEPCGPGCATSAWKHLFDVDVDSSGMFGFTPNAKFHPVRREHCGTHENQSVVFMAKSLTTGKIRMRQTLADLWYTFRPCQ
jgi:hypothetical protein